jgi:hypothetical protein
MHFELGVGELVEFVGGKCDGQCSKVLFEAR